MKATFIETSAFTQWVSDYLPDETLVKLQMELMENPEQGAVMQDCGGLRKVRIADPGRGRGKRGGARVIYLYLPEEKRFFLISIYGKGRKETLSPAEKKSLSTLAKQLKEETSNSPARKRP